MIRTEQCTVNTVRIAIAACTFAWAAPLLAADLPIDRPIGKEPTYLSGSPLYCLMVSGPKAQIRTWLVIDGDGLYIDRDGNGDLTDDGEPVPVNEGIDNPKGLWRHARVFEPGKVLRLSEQGTANDLTLIQLRFNPDYVASHPEMEILKRHLAPHWERHGRAYFTRLFGTHDGQRQQRATPIFGRSAKEAPIVHMGGPLAMGLPPVASTYTPVLQAGQESLLQVNIGTPGVGEGSFAAITHEGIPEDVHPVADITFPASRDGVDPPTLRVVLDQRCGGDRFLGPVRVPENVRTGIATVRLTFFDCPAFDVAPAEVTLRVIAAGE